MNKEFIKGKYNESFHDGLYRFQDQQFENSKSNGVESSREPRDPSKQMNGGGSNQKLTVSNASPGVPKPQKQS